MGGGRRAQAAWHHKIPERPADVNAEANLKPSTEGVTGELLEALRIVTFVKFDSFLCPGRNLAVLRA